MYHHDHNTMLLLMMINHDGYLVSTNKQKFLFLNMHNIGILRIRRKKISKERERYKGKTNKLKIQSCGHNYCCWLCWVEASNENKKTLLRVVECVCVMAPYAIRITYSLQKNEKKTCFMTSCCCCRFSCIKQLF